jgi:hypothetical protein
MLIMWQIKNVHYTYLVCSVHRPIMYYNNNNDVLWPFVK